MFCDMNTLTSIKREKKITKHLKLVAREADFAERSNCTIFKCFGLLLMVFILIVFLSSDPDPCSFCSPQGFSPESLLLTVILASDHAAL